MQRIIISVTILLSALTAISGCTFFPGVHKIDIQQGNRVTQEMTDKLELGMNRNQVKYILGTPMVADTFSQSRWDYFYSFKPGSKKSTRKLLTLHFKGDSLSQITGDYLTEESLTEERFKEKPLSDDDTQAATSQ